MGTRPGVGDRDQIIYGGVKPAAPIGRELILEIHRPAAMTCTIPANSGTRHLRKH